MKDLEQEIEDLQRENEIKTAFIIELGQMNYYKRFRNKYIRDRQF